jgi:predicted acyl esterase
MRGTGASGGAYYGEYLKQEQTDCIELINWLASQTWCNGRIGMYGKSWGGFNGLQVGVQL